jgi:hypothetical protein
MTGVECRRVRGITHNPQVQQVRLHPQHFSHSFSAMTPNCPPVCNHHKTPCQDPNHRTTTTSNKNNHLIMLSVPTYVSTVAPTFGSSPY